MELADRVMALCATRIWILNWLLRLFLGTTSLSAGPVPLQQEHQEYSIAPRVVATSTGAGLAAALADDAVGIVELLNDVTLQEADWSAVVVPVPLTRNVTIRSAANLSYAVLLDMGYVTNKVLLTPNHELNFERLVIANFRPAAPLRVAPGIDLLVASPPVAAGKTRPIARVRDGALFYRVCWSAAVQKAAPLPRRPAELSPQPQAWEVPPRPPGGSCSNSSTAPLIARCWALWTHSIDYGVEGMYLDAVGKPASAGYAAQLENVYGLCETLVSDECVAKNTLLACWTLAWGALGPPPIATPADPARHNAANATNTALGAMQGGEDSTSPSDGSAGDVPLQAVLPAVLLGGAAVLAVAVVGLLWWRRRQHASAYRAKDIVPGDGASRLVTSGDAEAGGSGCAGRAATARAPSAAIESEPQAGTEPAAQKLASNVPHASPPPQRPLPQQLNRSLSAAGTQRPGVAGSSGSPGPLTGRTPVPAHVHLDLVYGVDVVVDQDALRGAGGFGRVHEGTYRGERVAVKVLHMAGPRAPAADHLRQEAFVLSRCHHRNIVCVLGACLSPPHLCLVMELMEQSLANKLAQEPLLPLPEVLHIAADIASGLAYLHPTVVHRDLKPDNVLLDEQGTAKLTDFGLARLRETVCETQNPEAGTAPYMAPECFNPDNNVVTHKADMFSWAVVVWQLLAGKRPWEGLPALMVAFAITFEGKRLPLHNLPGQRCPSRLRDLVAECWDQDPLRRPCAEEVVKRLALVEEDLRCAAEPDLRPADSCAGPRVLSTWNSASASASVSASRGSMQATAGASTETGGTRGSHGMLGSISANDVAGSAQGQDMPHQQ